MPNKGCEELNVTCSIFGKVWEESAVPLRHGSKIQTFNHSAVTHQSPTHTSFRQPARHSNCCFFSSVAFSALKIWRRENPK